MSGERIIFEKIRSREEYYLHLKGLFLYQWCTSILNPSHFAIDLGCADGYGSSILSNSVNCVLGLDIDPEIIQLATEKYGNENRKFQSYNGETIPLPDGSCDAVIAFQVIEHVRNDREFLREIHRVLKRSGIAILATPNRLIRLPGKMKPWNVFHVREYSPAELSGLLNSVFHETDIYRLAPCEMIKEIEWQRIQRSIRIARLDIFALRRKLPRKLFKPILSLIHRVLRGNRNPDRSFPDPEPGETPLFRISRDNLDSAFDILAVCRNGDQ